MLVAKKVRLEPNKEQIENPSPHSRDFSHELGDARSL